MTNSRRISTSLCAMLLAAAPVAAQSGTLDQQSPFGNASFNAGTSTLTWQIQVRTGLDGQLEGFLLEASGSSGATVDLALRLGAGWNTSAAVWTGTLTCAGTGSYERHFFDVTSANLQLNAGDVFVIEANGNAGVSLRGQYDAPPLPPPYPEDLYLNGPGCYADCGWRIGFETWMLTGPSGPQLSVTGTCPGTITFTVSNGSGTHALIYGPAGSYTKPGGVCAGTTVDVNPPSLGAVMGNSLTANVPAGGCGMTVQVVDLNTCAVSNTLVL